MTATCQVATPLAAALRYRARWSVIPVGPDKRPLLSWVKYQERRASDDEIREWWSRWPTAGVAVVTGEVSNLAVVDVDNKDAETFQAAKDKLDTLIPDSLVFPTSTTPRRGLHYYFRRPEGGLRNGVGLGGLPVDVRGDGGYVVAPPTTGYEWRTAPAYLPPRMPDDLLEFVTSRASLADHGGSRTGSPLDVVVSGAVPGQRNDSLHRLAWSLLGRGLSAEVVIAQVRTTNATLAPPLSGSEVDSIMRSALSNFRIRARPAQPTAKLEPEAWPERGYARTVVDTIRAHSDAPAEFALFAGLTVAGAALGHNVSIPFGMTRVRTNLWTVMVADSTCSRKSVVLRAASEPLVTLAPQRIGSRCTPEALVDELNEGRERLFMHDEMTGLLAALGKDYNGGLREDLTSLYSGDTMRVRTRGRPKPVVIADVHLSMLAASNTTWLQERLKAGELRGGFASRWLAVCASPDRYEPFPSVMTLQARDRLHDELQPLLDMGERGGELAWTDEARAIYAEGRFSLEKPPEPCSPEIAALRGRLADAALKLALILQFDEFGGGTKLQAPAVARGLALARFSFATWQKLVGELSVSQFGRDLRRVQQVMREKARNGDITQRELLRALGDWKLDRLTDVGTTLEGQGLVIRSVPDARGSITWRMVDSDGSQTRQGQEDRQERRPPETVDPVEDLSGGAP